MQESQSTIDSPPVHDGELCRHLQRAAYNGAVQGVALTVLTAGLAWGAVLAVSYIVRLIVTRKG